MLEKIKTVGHAVLKFVLAAVVALIVLAAQVLGYYLSSYIPGGADLLATIFGALAALLGIVVLGGKKLLRFKQEDFKSTYGIIQVALYIALILTLFSLAEFVFGETEVVEGWPLKLVYTAIFALAVGVFEEGLFRGVILHGILGLFNGQRTGLYVSCIVAALVFGAAHLDFTSIDFSDGLQLAQAVLKVLQTAIFGFALAAAVVKTRSLPAAMSAHALYDFLLLIPTMALMGDTDLPEYVSSDVESGISTTVVLAIMCVIQIPIIIAGWKALRDAELPYRGSFMREKTPVAQYVPGQFNQAFAQGAQPVLPGYTQPVSPSSVQPVAPMPMDYTQSTTAVPVDSAQPVAPVPVASSEQFPSAAAPAQRRTPPAPPILQ